MAVGTKEGVIGNVPCIPWQHRVEPVEAQWSMTWLGISMRKEGSEESGEGGNQEEKERKERKQRDVGKAMNCARDARVPLALISAFLRRPTISPSMWRRSLLQTPTLMTASKLHSDAPFSGTMLSNGRFDVQVFYVELSCMEVPLLRGSNWLA